MIGCGIGVMRGGRVKWTPAKTESQYLWLRGDLGVTSSTTFTWRNQAANGGTANDHTNTGTGRPTAGTVSGLPAVIFSGSKWLQSSGFVAPSTDAEGIFVWYNSTTSGSLETLTSQNPATLGEALPYATTPVSGYVNFGTTSRKPVGDLVAPVSSLNVVTFQSSAGSWKMWINGALQYSTATNTYGMAIRPTMIGDGSGGISLLTGAVWEVSVSRIMTTATRAKWRAYLTARYGVSMSGGWV